MAPTSSSARDAVMEEIRRLLVDVIGVPIDPRPSHLLVDDLQLDSLSVITLAGGLEERFSVSLGEEDAMQLRTVEDLASFILAHSPEELDA